MGLTNEHVGPKILAKIKIYVLTRAELLFTLCYEIPCTMLEGFMIINCLGLIEIDTSNSKLYNQVNLALH